MTIEQESPVAIEQMLAELRAWRDQFEGLAIDQSAELEAERSRAAAEAAELRHERDMALRELEIVLERSAAVIEEETRQRRQLAAERAELEAELRATRRALMQHELSQTASSPAGRPGSVLHYETSAR